MDLKEIDWDRIHLAQEHKNRLLESFFNQLSNCQLLKNDLILGVGVCVCVCECVCGCVCV